jgi:translation elongation factor EF-G
VSDHDQQVFVSWLSRKLAGRQWTRVAPRLATGECSKDHGSRGSFARVTLWAEPASGFQFHANGAWLSREDQAYYEQYVVDGLVTALLSGASEPLTNIRVELSQAVVHDVDSNGNAFFLATVDAMRQILDDRLNTRLVDE